jgi:hypothetical protein
MSVNYNQPSNYKFIYSRAPVSTDSVSTVSVIHGINKNHSYLSHNKCAPINTAWHVLRLRMEERPPIRRVAANTLFYMNMHQQRRKVMTQSTVLQGITAGVHFPKYHMNINVRRF